MGRARDIANVLTTVQNIDVSSSLDSRIYINSASPTSGNTDGRIWINTTSASAPVLQTYGSGQFRQPALSNFFATGGTITEVNGYKVHTFTGSNTFTVASGSKNVEYLIVAAGGGAMNDVAGGGGGGGLISSGANLGPGTYTVVIGAGQSGQNGQN
jgi:hypothetical protein